MKHLQTFEDRKYKVELSQTEVNVLINMAVIGKDYDRLEEFLEEGLRSSKIFYNTVIKKVIDMKAVKIFIKYGGVDYRNKNNVPLPHALISHYGSNTGQKNFISVFSLLLDTFPDIDLLEKHNIYGGKKSFFDVLESKFEKDIMKEFFYDKILNIIHEKKPEQYELYMMEHEVEKFNL